MEHEFWHNAWTKVKQGWNQAAVNIHLGIHWQKFIEGHNNEKVFVPLCGQSIDMLWLIEYGHSVVGVELDHGSIERFFKNNKISYSASASNRFQTLDADNICIHTGDFFEVSASELQASTLVYDRAALVALPKAMRRQYVNKLRQILSIGSRIFLISMTYNENEMSGPPFSVQDDEIFELYGDGFTVSKIDSSSDPLLLGGLRKRGLTALTENVFFIERES